MQGLALQGLALQGLELQGLELQGLELQGLELQGLELQGRDSIVMDVMVAKDGEPVAHGASAAATHYALRAEGLRVSLRGTEVLRGVDLRASAGRVLAVLGPSGAGKTTLFRVLVGELLPDSGRVWLEGRDRTQAPLWVRARAGLGYMPQGPSVLLDLTVAENLRVFARMAGRREDPRQVAAEVELETRLGVRARELSGGERRRLELSRALTTRPRILVCDEPFAGVDPARVKHLSGLIRAHADSGAAVILADHRVREALDVCDDVVLLHDGRIELATRPELFSDHPLVRSRYLG